MDRHKSINIFSIEAKDIVSALDDGYRTKPNKKYKATLDYSLDVRRLLKIDRDFMFKKKDKFYTKNVVCLTFNYSLKEYNRCSVGKNFMYIHYQNKPSDIQEKHINAGIFIKDKKIIAISEDFKCNERNKDMLNKILPNGFKFDGEFNLNVKRQSIKTMLSSAELRDFLYNKSFIMDGERYIRYKRSSGSARVGKVLFIRKKYYDDMMRWSYMGIDKTGIVDLASLEAYISLTTSSIIDILKIEPKNILMIDDFEDNKFKDVVISTKNIEDRNGDEYLFSEKEEIEFSNNIWDGQSLIDKSLLGKYEDKGMVLLRNRFFKSACFNTNIQKYFNDNNITSISQLKGKTIATSIDDIKLITTPSSIKFMKFGKFDDYIAQLEDEFGIVKYEKPTKHFDGKLVSTHYQLINSLEFEKEEMKEFLDETIEYVNYLKNDLAVFKNHLKLKISENLELDTVDNTDSFIFSMLQHNDKFINTDLFVKFRKETVDNYINNVKKGHVLVRGSYGVLFGNPIEMLEESCSNWDRETCSMPKETIYMKYFESGKVLVGSRSPHVNSGNVLLTRNLNKNIKSEKHAIEFLEKYFNLSDNISVMNSFDDNVLERLSSADFDSDACLYTDNEILIKCAKKNYNKFLVPTSLVNGSKKPRMNRGSQKSDLDVKTSINLIGEIINCAQILNSIYSDAKNKKYLSEDELEKLYIDVCQLNVMSCIEIDKAKKEFMIDNQKELEKIKDKWYLIDEESGKIIKPIFFKFLAELNGHDPNCMYRNMECPMDYLHNILDSEIKNRCKTKRRKKSEKIVIADLFVENDVKIDGYSRKKMQKVIYESLRVKKYLGFIWSKNINSKDKYLEATEAKEKFIDFLKNENLNIETIKKIIHYVGKGRKSKTLTSLKSVHRMLFTSLFKAYKKEFLMILESTRQDNFTLLSEEYVESMKKVTLYGINFYYVEHEIN